MEELKEAESLMIETSRRLHLNENLFSIRLHHPKAITIARKLRERKVLSKYIENFLLIESDKITNTPEGLEQAQRRLIETMKTEKKIFDHKIRKLQTEKEFMISSYQEKIKKLGNLLEAKNGKN